VLPQSELRPIGNHNYGAIARLRTGVTPAQALAEINVVQKRFPEQAGGLGFTDRLSWSLTA
jgi:hypothetical protein